MEPTNETEPNKSELPPLPAAKEHVHTDMAMEYGPAPLEMAGNIGVKSPRAKTAKSRPDPNDPVSAVPLPALAPPPAQQPLLDDSMIADDTDLIEKEWVDKAKAIIAHTQDDPHLQNTEMSKVKAQYLKRRYDKDLKLEEDEQ